MTLTLNRILRGYESTIGELWAEKLYICDTIEDKVRPKGIKIGGKTAIPAGKYKVEITYSPKFKCKMPILIDVPNFTGIRIHKGNSSDDTSGCILPGYWDGIHSDYVSNSTLAYTKVFNTINGEIKKGNEVFIQINNEWESTELA